VKSIPNSYLPKNSTKEGNNMITVHICTTNILCHIINFDDMLMINQYICKLCTTQIGMKEQMSCKTQWHTIQLEMKSF
jgi:hypothetical protein